MECANKEKLPGRTFTRPNTSEGNDFAYKLLSRYYQGNNITEGSRASKVYYHVHHFGGSKLNLIGRAAPARPRRAAASVRILYRQRRTIVPTICIFTAGWNKERERRGPAPVFYLLDTGITTAGLLVLSSVLHDDFRDV